MSDQTFTAFASERPSSPIEDTQWVQLLPRGRGVPIDGRAAWSVDDPEGIIAASRVALARGMPVDFNHAMESQDRTVQAPAAGWIEDLEARADGVLGLVRWTPEGRSRIAGREYRYVSPVFAHGAGREITRIIRAGLTNTPALEMAALCSEDGAASENEGSAIGFDDFLKMAARTMRLDESADPAAIMATLLQRLSAAMEGKTADAMPLEQVADFLAGTAKAQAERETRAKVAQAIHSGRLPPALEDWGVALAGSDLAAFRAFVSRSPFSLGGGRLVSPVAPMDSEHARIGSAEAVICAQLGIASGKLG